MHLNLVKWATWPRIAGKFRKGGKSFFFSVCGRHINYVRDQKFKQCTLTCVHPNFNAMGLRGSSLQSHLGQEEMARDLF